MDPNAQRNFLFLFKLLFCFCHFSPNISNISHLHHTNLAKQRNRLDILSYYSCIPFALLATASGSHLLLLGLHHFLSLLLGLLHLLPLLLRLGSLLVRLVFPQSLLLFPLLLGEVLLLLGAYFLPLCLFVFQLFQLLLLLLSLLPPLIDVLLELFIQLNLLGFSLSLAEGSISPEDKFENQKYRTFLAACYDFLGKILPCQQSAFNFLGQFLPSC